MNLVKLFKYLFLGLLQGFTEPLPISSSGHLVIFKKLLGGNFLNDLNFEIVVNFGSFLAILFLFRHLVWELICDFFLYLKTKEDKYKSNFNYVLLLIVATIPCGILGFLFKDSVEAFANNVKFVGGALLVTAFMLYMVSSISGNRKKDDLTFKDAIIVGLFQVMALLPGISRSGATITGGLSRKMDADTALNFSFLLYLPISFATMILGVSDLVHTPNIGSLSIYYFLSMIVSMLATYFAALWFMDIVRSKKLKYFVYYCLVVGVLVIIFL